MNDLSHVTTTLCLIMARTARFKHTPRATYQDLPEEIRFKIMMMANEANRPGQAVSEAVLERLSTIEQHFRHAQEKALRKADYDKYDSLVEKGKIHKQKSEKKARRHDAVKHAPLSTMSVKSNPNPSHHSVARLKKKAVDKAIKREAQASWDARMAAMKR